MTELAYIGIGSNMGDPVGNCQMAIRMVSDAEGITIVCGSSFYRTEPVGLEGQPWFVNCVIQVQVSLSSKELLTLLQAFEQRMGRRRILRWGPRVIDLDILLFGDLILDEEYLIIPHPRLHQRRFVLEPLCEIDPDCIHPRLGKSMKALLDEFRDEKEVIKIETQAIGAHQ